MRSSYCACAFTVEKTGGWCGVEQLLYTSRLVAAAGLWANRRLLPGVVPRFVRKFPTSFAEFSSLLFRGFSALSTALITRAIFQNKIIINRGTCV